MTGISSKYSSNENHNENNHRSSFTVSLKTIVYSISAAILLATIYTAVNPYMPIRANMIFLTPTPTENAVEPTTQSQNTGTDSDAIAIIAGHWGTDSGAVCPDGLTEKDINLNIATLVQQELEQNGIHTILMKENDPRLNDFSGLALISLHADTCDYINAEATGFKISPSIYNENVHDSAKLVSCIKRYYKETTGLPIHESITKDMTNYHAFEKISSQTTAVIMETGFMNLDRQLLEDDPQRVAEGIVKGILCFINE